ncbi:MAG: arylsulfotransferase (asst), partial [Halobacteriaceae archaeon]
MVLARLNLTTGAQTLLYSTLFHHIGAGRWHDADRLSPTEFVVADIRLDRVFVLNTTTGLVEWAWWANEDYPYTGGGNYPTDWTHLNDVEVLPDGRIMA